MIIDAILERKDGEAYTRKSLKYIYDEAMIFEFHDLARAIDSGNEEDIKRELCAYIDNNGYPKNIKKYVKKVDWLTDKEDEPEAPAPAMRTYAKGSRVRGLLDLYTRHGTQYPEGTIYMVMEAKDGVHTLKVEDDDECVYGVPMTEIEPFKVRKARV